jgi:hypothetical protein
MAAPAIVRPGLLMPVKPIALTVLIETVSLQPRPPFIIYADFPSAEEMAERLSRFATNHDALMAHIGEVQSGLERKYIPRRKV